MTQTAFHAALLDPDHAVPAGLTGPGGAPAGKRFAVYRNNVAVGLTQALETGFPVLRRLLGDAFFAALAGVFLRAHPPRSQLMMHYGAEMPEFLAGFPPVAHLAYLPDVARLELALRAAYHAADAAPLPVATLASLPPDRLMAARLRLAPAVRLIRSAHPVHGIWLANTAADAPPPRPGPEDALILRPGFDPTVHCLPPGGGAFVAALCAGATVGDAADAAGPDHDLTATLALLLDGGAIVGFEETPA